MAYQQHETLHRKPYRPATANGQQPHKKPSRKLDNHEMELVRFKREETTITIGTSTLAFEGKVVDFDRYTISLQTQYGRKTIFKSAIQYFCASEY